MPSQTHRSGTDFVRWALTGLLALCPSLGAQQGELRVDLFDRVTVDDGLPHRAVWAIHQDRQGFIWIGTGDGLARYDGLSFKVYRHDPERPESISSSVIEVIYEDGYGELWIGTGNAGLNRFRRSDESFERFLFGPDATGWVNREVTCMFEDHAGVLWVGTFGGGLHRFDRRRGGFATYRHDPRDAGSLGNDLIRAIGEDGDRNLWIGTDEGGLDRFERRTETFVHYRHDPDKEASLSHDKVYAISKDHDGNLWIGTHAGLNRYDRATDSFAFHGIEPAGSRDTAPAIIHRLLVDRKGELWVGTQGRGLARLDPASGSVVRYLYDPAEPRSLINNSVLCIFEDETGVLWFGSYVGVSRYDRRREQFATYRHRSGQADSLSSNNIGAIYEDTSGALWVGTYDNGLNKMDRKKKTVVHYEPNTGPGSLPNGFVAALYEDRSGALWAGTWGGLARFDRGRDRWDQFGNDFVYSLLEDSSGRFWVCTLNGLKRFDRAGETFTHYPLEPGQPAALGTAAFFSILEDRSGELWFGSATSGLFRLAGGRFERMAHDPEDPDSLRSDGISCLLEDTAGNLWIGTYGGGLHRLDPGRGELVHFGESDGLADDYVRGILEDEKGRLWLSTDNGLAKFDPRARTFENYDVGDGLQGRFYSHRSFYRSPSGEMFFGGSNGLNAFFPDRVAKEYRVPAVVITDFLLFNEPALLRRADPDSPLERSILETREIVLSHRDYVFSFEFAALDYTEPRQNRYSYRLDGFDRDWVSTSAMKRSAPYSNLPPGRYVFRVKGSSHDQVWNEEGAEVALVVLAPPWKSWWAFSGYALALSAIMAAFVRSQQRKLQHEREIAAAQRKVLDQHRIVDSQAAQIVKQAAELEARHADLLRFTRSVSHDFRNPLTTIQLYLGLLERVLGGEATRIACYIEKIRCAAASMERLSGALVDVSSVGASVQDPTPVDLGRLVRRAARKLATRIAERGVCVDIANDLPVVMGDARSLAEAVQNLLENAVKFLGDVPDPCVEVGLRRQDGVEVLFVRDNGIGIAPRYHERIFGLFEQLDSETEGTGTGLALAQRIVELHGGRIWVESEGCGRGSTFCVALTGDLAARGETEPPQRPYGSISIRQPAAVSGTVSTTCLPSA